MPRRDLRHIPKASIATPAAHTVSAAPALNRHAGHSVAKGMAFAATTGAWATEPSSCPGSAAVWVNAVLVEQAAQPVQLAVQPLVLREHLPPPAKTPR